MDATVADGNDAVITLDGDLGDKLRLMGVNADDLAADDFIFTAG